MTRTGGRPDRRAAVALIALALFLRALIPSGWMPAEGRLFTLEPCPAAAPVPAPAKHHAHSMAVTQGDHAEHERNSPTHDQPCAFAPFAAALLTPDPLPPLLATFPVLLVPARLLLVVAIGRGLAAPPPPATGPPTAL